MRRNKHPNECPTCEKIPCQCAGGGAADDEKSKNDNDASKDSKSDVSPTNNSVNAASLNSQLTIDDKKAHITLFDENNQLMRCMLFASTANQPVPTPSNDLQEDNGSNATNTSVDMGMTMGGKDE